MKLNFYADEHQNFLLIDAIIFDEHDQAGRSKVLKIRRMQYLCNISRKNWVIKLMFCLLINMKVFYKFILHAVGQACPKYSGKFEMSLWHLKKEVRNEVRYLTVLAGSNTTLTTYYTSNVLSPLTFFLSQHGTHTKSFLHLINCLCNISLLLLFQVTAGPCKFVCCYTRLCCLN